MPNGVRFTFEPAWDKSDYRSGIEYGLRHIKTYTVMGYTASIVRDAGLMEFVDEDPPSCRWIARGLPVQVGDDALQRINDANETAKREYRFQDLVEVFEYAGARWVLSPFQGCSRSAVNVRARLLAAKRLGCQYVVENGSAKWVGQIPFRVEG